MRIRALLVALFVLPALTPAQEPVKPAPKADDAVAAELLKGKEAYVAALDKARDNLLKGFDKLYDLTKNNKLLKVDAQLAQLEKIEAEKKAFEENGVPPTLTGMKVALSEYRAAQRKAEFDCKAAFEKAAKAYRDQGEVKLAAATLEEMKEFVAKPAGAAAAPPTVIATQLSNKVFGLNAAGTHVVTAEYAKGDQTQLWRVVPAAEGWSHVENVKTGLVLTVDGKNNSTQATLTKKEAGSDNQLWKLPPFAKTKGAVKLSHKASGKVLGVDGRSKGSGARIILWTDENDASQSFGLFPPK
jgi:hypothetical protein